MWVANLSAGRAAALSEDGTRVLVIGYGNPGRQDDGLGPAMVAALEEETPAGVTVDADYQLTVEDAAAAAEHDVVVFADAAVKGREPFFFRAVSPEQEVSFSTHSCSPGAVLSLAEQGFGRRPRGYALGVRGYCFDEFGESLSREAQANLDAAIRFLREVLTTGRFDEALTE